MQQPCPHQPYAPRAQYSVTTAGGSRHTPRYMTMEGWRRLAIMAASCGTVQGVMEGMESTAVMLLHPAAAGKGCFQGQPMLC